VCPVLDFDAETPSLKPRGAVHDPPTATGRPSQTKAAWAINNSNWPDAAVVSGGLLRATVTIPILLAPRGPPIIGPCVSAQGPL
jgi:hypothetical protein